MATMARPRPAMPQAGAATDHGAHRPARAGARHGATLTTSEVTSRQVMMLVAQGTLIGCVILAVLGIAYLFFGDALRASFMPIAVPAASNGPAARGPTVVYRDRGDGTVMVMEIDGNGTRIKGSMKRSEVPMMLDAPEGGRRSDPNAVTPQSRVNALGSAFR